MQILRDVKMKVTEADTTDDAKMIELSYYTIGGCGKLTLFPEALLPCTNKRLKQILKMFKDAWDVETELDFINELIDQCLSHDDMYDDLIKENKDLIEYLSEKGKPVISCTYNDLIKYQKAKVQIQKNYEFLKERREKI